MTQIAPLMDPSALARIREEVGVDSALLLLASLEAEIRSGQKMLATYLNAGDMHLLETRSHALKSAARSFGAMQLGDTCRKLELAAKEAAGTEALAGLLQEFDRVSSETLQALTSVD